MKKKLSVMALVAMLCSSVSLFSMDMSSLLPTKEHLSFSYQHAFNSEHSDESRADIMAGQFRMGASTFWNDSHVGLGVNLCMGGPYTFSIKNKQDGSILKVPMDNIKGFNFGATIGCAVDIPINNMLNISIAIGPSYDYLTIVAPSMEIKDMLFGLGTILNVIISPNSLVNFVYGLDFNLYFLQLGYTEINRNAYEAPAHTLFTEIKPYIGISIKTSEIFRSATHR